MSGILLNESNAYMAGVNFAYQFLELDNRPCRPPRRRLRKVRLPTRSGSPRMMVLRSVGLKPNQLPISVRVRPQPMQKPLSGSTTQTLMQGVSISGRSSAFMA